jgi:hypothetical protein
MARAASDQRGDHDGSPSTLRAELSAIIERALALLDELDGDADAEPSLCGLEVGPGDDQDREGEDDNGVADDGGRAWVLGGTFPMPPARIPTRRVRRNSRRA